MAEKDFDTLNREYWNRQPCNIKHGFFPIATHAYFDQVSARRYFVEPHIFRFCDFKRWKGKKVLEIGCGLGTDGVNFASFGADYTGIDISDVSVDLCRRNFQVNQAKGAIFVDSIENIVDKYPPKYFDLVYSMGVLHHINNPYLGFKNAAILGKSVWGMVYASNSWKNFMIKEGLDQYEAQSGVPKAATFTKEELQFILQAYFQHIEIEQTHIFPWKIKEYKEYEYVKEPWFEAMPEEIFNILQKNIGWHLLFKAS